MSRSTVVAIIRTCHICALQFAGPYGTHIRESEPHQSILEHRDADQRVANWRANHRLTPS